jgi:hypothetical protein
MSNPDSSPSARYANGRIGPGHPGRPGGAGRWRDRKPPYFHRGYGDLRRRSEAGGLVPDR